MASVWLKSCAFLVGCLVNALQLLVGFLVKILRLAGGFLFLFFLVKGPQLLGWWCWLCVCMCV